MTIVCRPINEIEKDLLKGNESETPIIKNLDKVIVAELKPPVDGWTHDTLESIDYCKYSDFGWDAYLKNDDGWIGSSEI